MSLELFLNIATASEVLNALNFILAIVLFSRRSTEAKIIGLFCLCSIVTYVAMHTITLHGKEVNMPQTICGIFQFLITTLLYSVVLNRKYQKRLLVVALASLTFGILNLIFWQKMEMNSYTMSLNSFIVLVYCVIYWYKLMVELPVQQLHRFPMFWYNSAFMIFHGGTLFLYLFASYLKEVLHNDLLIYWTFHNIFGNVERVVIMAGLWQDLRNIKSGSSLLQAQ